MRAFEQLLLLFVKDNGKPDRWITTADMGLRAGALVDLTAAGAVELTNDKRSFVIPLDDVAGTLSAGLKELLDAITAKCTRRGKIRAYNVVSGQWFDARGAAATDLGTQGVVKAERSSLLGFPRTSLEIVTPDAEVELRQHLVDVLYGKVAPSVSDVATLVILKQLHVAKHVLGPDAPKLKRRDFNKRIDAIAAAFETSASDAAEDADVNVEAVRYALQSVNTMLIVAATS